MHEKEVWQGGGSQILPVLLGWGPICLGEVLAVFPSLKNLTAKFSLFSVV